jgi:Domain of unknown function (DUF1937)
MIYLASPYSDPDPTVRERRFRCAEIALFLLLRDRVWAYSPIVHCHELANRNKLPTTHDFWLEYDFDFLRRSDALYTLVIDGWERSIGVAGERKFAAHAYIPRYFLYVDFPNSHHDFIYSVERDNHELK